jgi:hypothetical protein
MEHKDPQKILDSLDSWVPVKAPPFFASRVMARWENLQESDESRPFWQVWWKPALLLAATGINLLLIFGIPGQTTTTQDPGLNALMQEYQLNDSQSDDITLYNL